MESQGREYGADGNNQRSGQQGPRNKNYKGKGFAYDNSKYEDHNKPGYKRSKWRFFKEFEPIHLLPKKTSKRYAMDSRGINDLNTQDIGQHLDENQKLMLDAFRSGKSGEKGQLSVSKTRKSLTFEDNSSTIAVEDLKSAEDTLHKEADVPKEADIKESER